MSFLRAAFEVVRVVFAVLSLLIALAELLHEDNPKAGAEKKAQVLKWWNEVLEAVRETVGKNLGDAGLKVLDWLSSEKVVSFVIDVIVFVFNMRGFFRK